MVQWDLAEECLLKAGDLNGLLLLYTSIARGEGIEKLAQLAVEQGKNNIAFMCYFQLRRVDACIDLLCDTGRIPEAAFFARTYAPGYTHNTTDTHDTHATHATHLSRCVEI